MTTTDHHHLVGVGPVPPPTAGATADAVLQRTTGRWAALAPIRAQDHDWLRTRELGDDLGVRWRLRGTTPGPDRWAQGLYQGVLAQHLVVRRRDGQVVGLACAYDADLQDGTCSVGVARLQPDPGPAFGEGVALFVDHLFQTWPFRKVCSEAAEHNLVHFAGLLDGIVVEEGRRQAHRYAGGRYWDVALLALWRDRWSEVRDRLLPEPTDAAEGDLALQVVVPS